MSDQNKPGHDFRLEGGGVGEFRVQDGRTQVGEEVELLADAQQAAFGALVAGQRIPLGTADGAEEHRVGRPGEGAGGFRERRAGGIHGAAAEQAVLDLEGQTVPAQGVEHAQGLLHDFGTDAVTRQNKNLHGVVRIRR